MGSIICRSNSTFDNQFVQLVCDKSAVRTGPYRYVLDTIGNRECGADTGVHWCHVVEADI